MATEKSFCERAGERTGNFILDSLTADEFARLSPALEYEDLTLERKLDPAEASWFPVQGAVSILLSLETGASSEIALVGPEGMLGLSSFLRGNLSDSSPSTMYKVQVEGRAIKLSASALKQEFQQGGHLQQRLLEYAQVLFMQAAHTALCNRHHSVEQQLCRWLLLSLDRVRGNELGMTQGMIADMLGVRRAGVSMAASQLQQQGIIRYSRGRIVTLDRPGLESKACECYRRVRAEYERFHGPDFR